MQGTEESGLPLVIGTLTFVRQATIFVSAWVIAHVSGHAYLGDSAGVLDLFVFVKSQIIHKTDICFSIFKIVILHILIKNQIKNHLISSKLRTRFGKSPDLQHRNQSSLFVMYNFIGRVSKIEPIKIEIT